MAVRSFFRNFAKPIEISMQIKMKNIIPIAIAMLLLVACGQSYEETKRITRQQRLEAWRKDSAALKIAVMPTLDCLPLYVAHQQQLFDSLNGGVRLKFYNAQMDCDTAIQRGRVEGMVTDLVRAMRIDRQGVKMRYVAQTNAYWQLVANRNARIKQLKQLDDKMVAMTRYSATDLLTDLVIDTVKLQPERVFKVQINDLGVRLQMLLNNEMDALWFTEPQATQARIMKNNVVMDSRDAKLQLGVLVFRDKEMQRKERAKQLGLFIKAYNEACDAINSNGVAHYRDILMKRMNMKASAIDSLPKTIRFEHVHAPRQQDMALVEKWLEKTLKEGKNE